MLRINDGTRAVARSRAGVDASLRGYLLAERREFRALMVNALLDHSAESAQIAWTECSGRVDALESGEAVAVRRYELPPDHRLAPPHGGRPCDWLLLGADDTLVEAAR